MTPSRFNHAVLAVRPAATLAAMLLFAGAAAAGTLKVPADFATIQAAVDAAVPGDVIVVSKGVYAENVVVAVGGITLQGKNAVIDGRYAGNCLDVTGDGVTVTGFTLANGGSGVVFAGAAGPADGIGPAAGGLHCIGAGAVIGFRRFYRVAGIPERQELHAFDDAAAFHVQTRNEAFYEHASIASFNVNFFS